MDFKKLFETDGDERAVSPVIGVILMVAITVILAAVIGAFVIGIGDDQEAVPQASFDFDDEGEDGDLTITHSAGDSIDESNLDVTNNGVELTTPSWSSDPVSAGATFEIPNDNDGDDLNDDPTIRVVWESDSGGDSSVLATYEVSR
ncbi:type IV pilin [Natranaeroarchaeum aerophilus]|uniref:Type IV pilin N-terminal domain-containing protein n=1 Tax=Natranaeroarchaeum aerophilus TaxID=2917711 RepID=A0AAE3K3D9_9EURY|nr:type IV pilin N-terminal domain-containing protein [Natranaeroarchaeum aerophilus]MCL9812562.1 type IV pilin N-terminal domain-containing protein [Natranaeroarchaeum aerophilus]